MEKDKSLPVFLLTMFLLVLSSAWSPAHGLSSEPGGEEGILVGRVSYVAGAVFRYAPEQGEWVQVGVDSPFGFDDRLRSEPRSRAEVILPNNTWFRMGDDTHLELISLQNDGTEMHMVRGVARFMNKGSISVIQVSTPFGEVSAPAQTSFDLLVGDTSMEVAALEGSVYFSRTGDRLKTEVTERSASLVADHYAVAAGRRDRDAAWDGWNLERDALWVKRMDEGRVSAKYLPPALHDHSYALDGHGVWQRVYYEGAHSYFWRPLYVSAGWAPYTAGRWSLWYGDHVWLPCEPFGYVTHHYGSWVHTGGYWYWAPPVTAVTIHWVHPSLRMRPLWYPGRVAWFHVGAHIGWIPLMPYEPYYAYRRWGPRAIAVKNVTVVNVNVREYRNERRAVMIDSRKLHTAQNYRNVSIRTVDPRTVGARVQAQPTVAQRQGARDPGRAISSPGSGRAGSPSPANAGAVGRERQTSRPARVTGPEPSDVTRERAARRSAENLVRSTPAPVVQPQRTVTRSVPRGNQGSAVVSREEALQRNPRQLPPQVGGRDRGNTAVNRERVTPSRTWALTSAAQAPTQAPAPATPSVRRPATERLSPGTGTATRELPQPRARGLEQSGPEVLQSPGARVRGQGAMPGNAPGRSAESTTRMRGGSFVR